MGRSKKKPIADTKMAEELQQQLRMKPLTPELRAWALKQYTDEEHIKGLDEARASTGPDLGQLIRELEQEVLALPPQSGFRTLE